MIRDIQARIGSSVTLPEGYFVEYGRPVRQPTACAAHALGAGIAAVIGILVILFQAFGRPPSR